MTSTGIGSPSLSVVIPYHGGPSFLRRSVTSVLAQTYAGFEVIVVDDCSVDQGSRLVDELESVRVIRHARNHGVSAARNTGAKEARGEILAFLDQDDWWPPELVAEIVPGLAPGRARCYDCEITDADGTPTGETLYGRTAHWPYRSLTRDNMHVYFSGAPILKGFVHRSDFHRVGGFDSRFDGVEDFHFFVKLLTGGVTLDLLDRPRGFYRVHASSQTKRVPEERGIDSWLRMADAMPRELDLPPNTLEANARARRYWSARAAEARLVSGIRRRELSAVLSPGLARQVARTLPDLARLEATKLVQRVRPLLARRSG